MPLHRQPLTEAQISLLQKQLEMISRLKYNVYEIALPLLERDGDELLLLDRLSSVRGTVQQLDLELFSLIKQIHEVWASNYETLRIPTPTPESTTEDLLF